MSNTNPTFVLVHGSWHDGSSWAAVAGHLEDAGFRCLTPTLAGHGPVARGRVTHGDYVRSVLDAVEPESGPLVLVGHSFGGSVISRFAELRPERCRLLVYYSAVVPLDGERVADSLPAPFVAFLDSASAASSDGSVSLPRDIFGSSFANTADEPAVEAIYEQLVPEPYDPIFERLSLPPFPRLGIPTAYISCRKDLALPPGTFQPGQSSRLAAPRLLEIDSDHEALFTAADVLAEALRDAVDLALGSSARPKVLADNHPDA